MAANSEPRIISVLRAASLAALPAGAAVSVALTLWAGHRNSSQLLIALFVLWVLAPFAGLAIAHVLSRRWSVAMRAGLSRVTLFIAVFSVAIYAWVALGPPRPKPAAFFLVVPAASWLLIAAVMAFTALISRRQA